MSKVITVPNTRSVRVLCVVRIANALTSIYALQIVRQRYECLQGEKIGNLTFDENGLLLIFDHQKIINENQKIINDHQF